MMFLLIPNVSQPLRDSLVLQPVNDGGLKDSTDFRPQTPEEASFRYKSFLRL